MTLESLIAAANAQGWRVCNLFQLFEEHTRTPRWQANLRSSLNEIHEFGTGETAVAALTQAMERVRIELAAVPAAPVVPVAEDLLA